MILGAHIFISGGLSKAGETAKQLSCEAIQIFTKNNNQWQGKPLTQEDGEAFQESVTGNAIQSAFAHTSYLINLGSPKPELHKKSLAAIQDEVKRATTLGLSFVVLHPGAHTGSGEKAALTQIAKSIKQVLKEEATSPVQILFENTAGQGTCVGYSFEHLALLLEEVGMPKRTGVCFDTCHAFAAGYALQNKTEYQTMVKEFDRLVGLKALKAFHLNDSKKDRGCHVDRHEHIGQGKIGLPFFELLMNDDRFENTPMVLETPKGKEQAEDVMNLKVLRSLIKNKKKREKN